MSHPQRYLAVFCEHGNVKHQASQQLLHHGRTQVPVEKKKKNMKEFNFKEMSKKPLCLFSLRIWPFSYTEDSVPRHLTCDGSVHSELSQWDILADSQQAVLDGVPLSLGERPALGQPVDGLQRGVHQLSVVIRAGKQGGAAGQQRQQGRADVSVHGQRRFSGAQHFLWVRY